MLAPPFEIKAKDGESVSVFIPFAKKEVEVERKKATDYFIESLGVKVQDDHQKAGKRTPGASRPLFTGGSQSPQEQWSKETPKESMWKEITKFQCEMGSLIKERRAKWHESCEKARKGRRTP